MPDQAPLNPGFLPLITVLNSPTRLVVIDHLSAESFRHLNASVVLAEDSLSIAEDPRNTIVKILKAANVEEAVAVATELKRNGQYDWFRGQLREWNPASSLERKLHQNPGAQIEINAKLDRFFTWAQAYPALAYLLQEENIDALVAVLQHYGVATSYIDFTTEPSIAGFFASDATTLPVEEGNSVIYCLNTTDLVEFYDDLKIDKAFMHLQAMPVTVDVRIYGVYNLSMVIFYLPTTRGISITRWIESFFLGVVLLHIPLEIRYTLSTRVPLSSCWMRIFLTNTELKVTLRYGRWLKPRESRACSSTLLSASLKRTEKSHLSPLW